MHEGALRLVNYNKQFPHFVEDWILWLGCRVDKLGNIIDFPFYVTPPVKVANYDVAFIENTGQALVQGIGFTKSQSQLAVRIITKHRKQIKKQLNIDVDFLLTNPEFKLPIRDVQNNFEIVNGSDNYYIIKFPYQPKMVDRMHNLSAHSSGDFRWNSDDRLWSISKTEKNLKLLYKFLNEFNKHPWKVDNSIQQDLDVAHQAITNYYNCIPNIDLVDNQYVVNNSNEYVDRALIDFDFSQPVPDLCLRLEKYGLFPGKNLTTYVQNKYTNISSALLTGQTDILKLGRKFESPVNYENLEDIMKSVNARFWVFITLQKNSTSASRAREIAFNTPTVGEVIFLSHNRGSHEDSASIISDLDLKDSIIITDNSMIIGKYYTKKIIKTPVMKMFYLFGE